MGTPADLEDLAVGFSVTEGIVRDPAGVRDIAVARTNLGIELRMEIDADAAAQLESRRASAPSGAEAIGEALRVPRRLDHTLDFSRAAIWRANDELGRRQSLNEETSSVHAAAWANMAGDLQVVREDISRHNALDKVLGALMREGRSVHEGFVIVTSRASCEMVQKVAACSVELMAAISRPTGLAMRIAQSAGVTLVGLVRERTANVYSVPARIT
jgi:FdhD protein